MSSISGGTGPAALAWLTRYWAWPAALPYFFSGLAKA